MSTTSGGTVYFKSCLRCGGDRTLENDFDGWYVLCSHCGHVTYPDIPDARAKRRAESTGTYADARPAVLRPAAFRRDVFPGDEQDWRDVLEKAS